MMICGGHGRPPAEFCTAPAGASGPAFMTGHNFRTILRYNNAVSYALGVALLSDRIAGEPGVQAGWPRDQATLSNADTRALQRDLNRLGYGAGTPDGSGVGASCVLASTGASCGMAPTGAPCGVASRGRWV